MNILKVKYGEAIILDENCMVEARNTFVYPVQLYLPNYIRVSVSTNQTEYVKGSDFSLEITTDTGGYFWVYSIAPNGKFSHLFPIPGESYDFENKFP